ncbi:MAG: hypothetical protein QM756_02960 [Polyangiaceae bacterium]
MAQLSNRAVWSLLAAALAMFVLPLAWRLSGTTVGTFAMYTHPSFYRLRLIAYAPNRERELIPLAELGPHLGRDARRIVLPAVAWTMGETHQELLQAGLDDLGRLGCRLRPSAREVVSVLDRDTLAHTALAPLISRVVCEAAR